MMFHMPITNCPFFPKDREIVTIYFLDMVKIQIVDFRPKDFPIVLHKMQPPRPLTDLKNESFSYMKN